ncbi:MAG: hypothetical protein K2N05_12680 [Muribaculaceae bacterium]|nr:hypothetical protein [Muribaculaceae bacterium]
MKRNLLMLLFGILMGTFAANAETFTVNLSKAGVADVSLGSPYNDPVELKEGTNTVTYDPSSDRAVFVTPLNGMNISVKCDGVDLIMGGGGFYSVSIVEGMVLDISSDEEVPETVSVMLQLSDPGTASVTTGGETTLLSENFYMDLSLKTGEYAVFSPVEGYKFSETYFMLGGDNLIENSDGSVSYMPVANDYIMLTTKKEGLEFFVDVPANDLVYIGAWAENGDELGAVEVAQWGTPREAIAALGTYSITFWPAEGVDIKSIKRIQADGTESDVMFSAYAGYRTVVAAGDTFIVDALGPETDVTFYGFDKSTYGELDLSSFVVTVDGKKLELSGEKAEARIRIAQTVEVGAARGYELPDYALSGGCGDNIVTTGSLQSYRVNRSGDLFLYAKPMSGMIINVDNSEAVTVTGANGNGEVLTLVNGENMLESVQNPLKITANQGYVVERAVLDGEVLPAVDGSYVAELQEGSTLDITTAKEISSIPVTILTMGGEVEDLVILKNGKPAEYNGETPLEVKKGDELRINAALGSIIESLSDMNGNSVEYDDWDDYYTVTITKPACMISVTFKEVGEGKAFVGFSRDSSDVLALLYDKDGNRNSDPKPASLKAGRTVEVDLGDLVEITVWGDAVQLKTVTVNGEEITFDPADKVLDRIAIEGKTVIEVTTTEREKLVEIWGYDNIAEETGMLMGEIFINEVGQNQAFLRPGDKYYVIPVANKGYKFTGFRAISGNPQIPTPVDGKYEFTVPEGYETITIKGEFELDEENPAYLVEGNSLYDDAIEAERRLYGLVRIDDGTMQGTLHVMAYEGETVKLLFFQNIDDFPADQYYIESFCLFQDPSVLIPQNYVVNPKDVRYRNVISIGAIIKDKTNSVDEIAVSGSLSYDNAKQMVSSDTAVKVISTTGSVLKEFGAGENSLESLPSGVYILNNGVETVKIAK